MLLNIFDVTNPSSPTLLEVYGDGTSGVFAIDNRVYLMQPNGDVVILEIEHENSSYSSIPFLSNFEILVFILFLNLYYG